MNSSPKRFWGNVEKWLQLLFVICLVLTLSVSSLSAQEYLQYQEFIIPGPEELIYDSFRYLINNRTMSSDIISVISVTVDADQTVIHYDHWENGYGGTDESLTLNKGETHVFQSTVRVNPRDPSNVLYDGGDRIYVLGGSAFVSRTNWPLYPGPLLAMAFQVYPTQALESSFVAPVGDDLGQSDDDLPFADFKAVVYLIQSIEDGNNLTIEDDLGAVVWQGVLNKGECITDPIIYNIQSGYHIYGDEDFQVHILTGDNELEIGYEVNGVAGIPMNYWGTDYLIPLTSFQKSSNKNNNRTDLYLFNPNDYSITVQFEDSTTGNFDVDPMELVSYRLETGHYLPHSTGAGLHASDTFWGFGYACTGFDQYDWAFELVGDSLLSESYVVGWAPGDHNKQHNYSAVFVSTYESDVTVYVDYEQDDVVDDQFVISFPDVVRITDPNDYDMTGARIWAEEIISCVYGAIAGESTPESEPSIDSGYSIIYAADNWADQIMELIKSSNNDTVALHRSNGFSVSLKSYDQAISEIVISDSLPAGWEYIAGSASIFQQSTGLNTAQEPVITGNISDGFCLEWTVGNDMTVYDSLALVFEATPQENQSLGENQNQVRVSCMINGDEMIDNAFVTVHVVQGGLINGRTWHDIDYDGIQDSGEPGLETRVVLYNQLGEAIDSVDSGSDGLYSITNVTGGTYQLLFRPVSAFYYTKMDQGMDDDIDSDAQRDSGLTLPFTLFSDQTLEHMDCGYTDHLEADLQVIKDASTSSAFLHSYFTYTLTIHNHGPDDAINMTVDDSLSPLLSYDSGTMVPDQMVNNHLLWTIGNLPFGDHVQIEYQVRVEDIGEIDTRACVSSDRLDPVLQNNCESCLVNTYYPIELSSFVAEYLGHAVELKWISQSETENMGYFIYRSEELNGQYEQINKEMIPGAGNSQDKNEYIYRDETIKAGKTYYYKLADVDYEGIVTFHKPISMEVPLPAEYILEPNYPNPFNPETKLTLQVPQEGHARLEIYNMRGNKIRTLLQERIAAGTRVVTWNGCDESGTPMPSGIYFAIFKIHGFVQEQKMTLLK